MPRNAELKGGWLWPDPGPLPARSALDELVQPLSRGAPAAKMGETAAKGPARGRCSGPAAAACPRAQASWPSRPRRVDESGLQPCHVGRPPAAGSPRTPAFCPRAVRLYAPHCRFSSITHCRKLDYAAIPCSRFCFPELGSRSGCLRRIRVSPVTLQPLTRPVTSQNGHLPGQSPLIVTGYTVNVV